MLLHHWPVVVDLLHLQATSNTRVSTAQHTTICLPIGNSRCTQVSTLNRSHNNCTSPNCTSTICTSTNCTSTICTSTNCRRSVVRPSCLTNQRRGTQQSSGCAQAAWAHNLKSAGLLRSSKRHGSLEACAWLWLGLYSLYEHRFTTRGHFSSHCSTEVHRPVGRSYLYHGKATTQQHATNRTCDLLPACLCCNCFLFRLCLRHVLEPQSQSNRCISFHTFHHPKP